MKTYKERIKRVAMTLGVSVLMVSTCFAKGNLTAENNGVITINQVKADGKYEDLLPLKERLEKADVIGMGEATHGNKEFFQMKHRVFEFLVKEMNIKNFALEADFGGAQIVNNYILNNVGTAEQAAKGLGFSIYKIQEISDMLKWMHDYNLTVKETDKVHFYGFDMQRYDANKAVILKYAQKVGLKNIEQLEKDLTPLNDENMYNMEAPLLRSMLVKVNGLIKNLEDNKAAYVKKSSEREYQIVLKHVGIMKQNINHQLTGNKSDNRDAFMAENVQWILEYEKAIGRGKLFISGHNGHIEKSSSGMYRSMGANLAKVYSEKYYAIGTEFYKGTFLCRDEFSGSRKNFSLNETQASSFAKIMKDTGIKIGFVNCKANEMNKNLQKTLMQPQEFHMIGDSFSEIHKIGKQYYTLTQTPVRAYDGIIFIENVNPSTPIQ
ncbi:MAG: erythromycin esterase family protein [Cellulosilyticaceae bacterium]